MLGHQVVQTDRIIPNNKLDIIAGDNEEGTCMLTDVAISGGRIVIKKDVEKILKYKDQALVMLHMFQIDINYLSEHDQDGNMLKL